VTDSRRIQVSNWYEGKSQNLEDQVAAEVPLALTYNKRSHVVMMVTPTDLEDFALGFSLTEGIISQVSDISETRIIPREAGLEAAITVSEGCFRKLDAQRRNLVGRTGCGLCGAESLEQAVRFPAVVSSEVSISHAAIQTAISSMQDHQPLQAVTGAVHGAAWCNLAGKVLALREDVGRHNALDKLIGYLARKNFDSRQGFVLVSSRASYEMVYKVAAVGIELLVAVSAATTLAVDFAHRSGVTLVGFGRPGRHNVYTFGQRIE
jgi:FdhD protein